MSFFGDGEAGGPRQHEPPRSHSSRWTRNSPLGIPPNVTLLRHGFRATRTLDSEIVTRVLRKEWTRDAASGRRSPGRSRTDRCRVQRSVEISPSGTRSSRVPRAPGPVGYRRRSRRAKKRPMTSLQKPEPSRAARRTFRLQTEFAVLRIRAFRRSYDGLSPTGNDPADEGARRAPHPRVRQAIATVTIRLICHRSACDATCFPSLNRRSPSNQAA